MNSPRITRREALGWIGGGLAAALGPGCRPPRPTDSGPALAVGVTNEFGKLRSAIVHDGGNAGDVTMEDYRRLVTPEELARHPESGPSLRERLIEQHGRFRALLADHGVSLVAPETRAGAGYQVFTRDPCFAIGDTLFIAAPRDEWRARETAGLGAIRSRAARVTDLSGPGGTIEGGDVMVLDEGKRVLVGTNRRTTAGGFEKLARALAGSGTEVVRVPHEALHLDACLAPLPNREALYDPRALPDASVSALGRYFDRLVPLDREEAAVHLAANVFWLDESRVVSGTATKKTNALLRARGYEVIELDFSHLVRQWGSFRCVVCPLLRT